MPKKEFFLMGHLIAAPDRSCLGILPVQQARQSAADETATFPSAPIVSIVNTRHEQACDKKFLGKVIEVTGKIAAIQHSGQSEIWILATSAPGGGRYQLPVIPGGERAQPKAR